MNTMRLLGALLAATALNSAVAEQQQVASVARITGEAMVSQGTQYVSGREGMALSIGDRIMSLAASSTVIQFSDGCRYVLEENQLLTIESKSPCALGLVPQEGSTAAASGGAVAEGSLDWVPVGALGLVGVLGVALDTGSGNVQLPAISE